jgi:hypothetical protein
MLRFAPDPVGAHNLNINLAYLTVTLESPFQTAPGHRIEDAAAVRCQADAVS